MQGGADGVSKIGVLGGLLVWHLVGPRALAFALSKEPGLGCLRPERSSRMRSIFQIVALTAGAESEVC